MLKKANSRMHFMQCIRYLQFTDSYLSFHQFPCWQRFQKCQYARARLVKTEGRGWGLLADENIMVTEFILMFVLLTLNILK